MAMDIHAASRASLCIHVPCIFLIHWLTDNLSIGFCYDYPSTSSVMWMKTNLCKLLHIDGLEMAWLQP